MQHRFLTASLSMIAFGVAAFSCSKDNTVEGQDTVCATGEYTCQIQTLRICNDSRTGWIEAKTCGAGTRCDVLAKGCVPEGGNGGASGSAGATHNGGSAGDSGQGGAAGSAGQSNGGAAGQSNGGAAGQSNGGAAGQSNGGSAGVGGQAGTAGMAGAPPTCTSNAACNDTDACTKDTCVSGNCSYENVACGAKMTCVSSKGCITDADEDHYGAFTAGGDDCNDADPNVHPGVPVSCDLEPSANCGKKPVVAMGATLEIDSGGFSDRHRFGAARGITKYLAAWPDGAKISYAFVNSAGIAEPTKQLNLAADQGPDLDATPDVAVAYNPNATGGAAFVVGWINKTDSGRVMMALIRESDGTAGAATKVWAMGTDTPGAGQMLASSLGIGVSSGSMLFHPRTNHPGVAFLAPPGGGQGQFVDAVLGGTFACGYLTDREVVVNGDGDFAFLARSFNGSCNFTGDYLTTVTSGGTPTVQLLNPSDVVGAAVEPYRQVVWDGQAYSALIGENPGGAAMTYLRVAPSGVTQVKSIAASGHYPLDLRWNAAKNALTFLSSNGSAVFRGSFGTDGTIVEAPTAIASGQKIDRAFLFSEGDSERFFFSTADGGGAMYALRTGRVTCN